MAPEAVRLLAWAVSVLVQVEHKIVVHEASCLRKTVHALVDFSEHTSVNNEFVKILSGTNSASSKWAGIHMYSFSSSSDSRLKLLTSTAMNLAPSVKMTLLLNNMLAFVISYVRVDVLPS